MDGRLTPTDKLRLDLWTSRDMSFVIDRESGIGVIPRFTKCYKPSYTSRIKRYLTRMEEKTWSRPLSKPKAVCVHLQGQLRYVWRIDVLTEKEYEQAKEAERSSVLRVFGSKSGRTMGQGGSD